MEKINLNNYEAYFLDFAEGNLTEQQNAALKRFLEQYPHLREELNLFENIKLPNAETTDQNWSVLKKPDAETLKNNRDLRSEFFFKAVENTLQPVEVQLLDELLTIAEFKREFERWKRTKLQPLHEEVSKDEWYEFGLDRQVSKFNFEYYLIARAEGLLTAQQNRDLETFAAALPDGENQLQLADQLKLRPATGIFFPDKDKLYKKEPRPVVWGLYRAASVAVLLVLAAFIITFLNRPFAEKANLAKSTTENNGVDTAQKISHTPDSTRLHMPVEKHAIEADFISPKPAAPKNSSTQKIKQEQTIEVRRAEIVMEKIEIFRPEEIRVAVYNREPVDWDVYAYEAPSRQMEQESKLRAAVTAIPAAAGNFFKRNLIPAQDAENPLLVDLAKRFGTVGEALNAEIKKETTQVEGGEVLTYSFRIGSFEVSRSKTK